MENDHIAQVKQEHEAIQGVRLGDYILVEGHLERISVCRHDIPIIQTTLPNSGGWFLWYDGHSTFSGTAVNFNHAAAFDNIDKLTLREIGTAAGEFWTFKDGVVGAGKRENFMTQCRIFELTQANSDHTTPLTE